MKAATVRTGRLGNLLQWGIRAWVRATGTVVRLADVPWLAGPYGGRTIGSGVYEAYARDAGLAVVLNEPGTGLLADFGSLRGPHFAADRVDVNAVGSIGAGTLGSPGRNAALRQANPDGPDHRKAARARNL